MANQTPLVSVILPAYNAADYIAEALASVVAQTVADWEVVVCDDGSGDDTGAIAAGFGERVRVVRNERNQGLAAARNAAIGAARGRVLALLDADDTWLPIYLERQLGLLEEAERQRGRVGIVTCNAFLRDGADLRPDTYAEHFGYAEHVTIERLLDISPIFISSIIPRAALEQVGAFATDLRSCEDLDLWIRLLEAGYRVVSTREPLVVYRLSHGQLSAQPVAMARARQAVYRRAIARGRLSTHQLGAARRAIRRERGAEAASSLLADLRARRLSRVHLSDLALLARVAAENPSRWRRWLSPAGRAPRARRDAR
jgi:glycosyltransferase involved in cell wall biosynthesis